MIFLEIFQFFTQTIFEQEDIANVNSFRGNSRRSKKHQVSLKYKRNLKINVLGEIFIV